MRPVPDVGYPIDELVVPVAGVRRGQRGALHAPWPAVAGELRADLGLHCRPPCAGFPPPRGISAVEPDAVVARSLGRPVGGASVAQNRRVDRVAAGVDEDAAPLERAGREVCRRAPQDDVVRARELPGTGGRSSSSPLCANSFSAPSIGVTRPAPARSVKAPVRGHSHTRQRPHQRGHPR